MSKLLCHRERREHRGIYRQALRSSTFLVRYSIFLFLAFFLLLCYFLSISAWYIRERNLTPNRPFVRPLVQSAKSQGSGGQSPQKPEETVSNWMARHDRQQMCCTSRLNAQKIIKIEQVMETRYRDVRNRAEHAFRDELMVQENPEFSWIYSLNSICSFSRKSFVNDDSSGDEHPQITST